MRKIFIAVAAGLMLMTQSGFAGGKIVNSFIGVLGNFYSGGMGYQMEWGVQGSLDSLFGLSTDFGKVAQLGIGLDLMFIPKPTYSIGHLSFFIRAGAKFRLIHNVPFFITPGADFGIGNGAEMFMQNGIMTNFQPSFSYHIDPFVQMEYAFTPDFSLMMTVGYSMLNYKSQYNAFELGLSVGY